MSIDTTADESSARVAAFLGLAAMTLHMTMCCSSVLGLAAGTVLGGVALFLAMGIRNRQPLGAARAYANVGTYAGAASVVWGMLVTLGIVLYLLFYVLMIGGIFLAEGL